MKTGIIATILALLLLITFVSANSTPVLDISGCTAKPNGIEGVAYTCTVTATDADDTTLTFSLPTKPEGMTISSTGVITWIPNDEQIGSHAITVKVEDDEATPASDSESFTVLVRPDDVCEDYTSGSGIRITDWEITDDDEDFYPGSQMEIEVDVENEADEDLEDVVVEAVLYDASDGKSLESVKSEEFDVDEDEDATTEITLELPEEIDVNNNIVLFISVYEDGNDDENCDWEYESSLDFKRRKHDIAINEIILTPTTVKAGKTADIKIDLENVGARDENDAYIQVKNTELGISTKSDPFNIDAYESGDDDEYTIAMTLTVPAKAKSGSYDLEISVYDDDGQLYESGSEFVVLTIEGITTQSTSTATAAITTEGAPAEIEQGKSFNIPVQLTNTASEAKEYEITVTNIGDWADSTSAFDAYLTAGQSSTYYITVTPKKEAAEGTHSATILAKEGSTTIATKTLSFTIPEAEKPAITGGTVADINTEEKPVFQSLFKGTTPWIIGDLVLVIVAIVLLKMLFSKKEEK